MRGISAARLAWYDCSALFLKGAWLSVQTHVQAVFASISEKLT